MSREKLLWVSDHPGFKHVGQSRVTREFCSRLVEPFDVHVAGYGNPPEDHIAEYNINYPVHVIERWNTNQLIEVISNVDPDIIFLSHDIWMFPKLPDIKSKFPNKKVVAYVTVDGEPFSNKWKYILDCCDFVVTPSQYGKSTIQSDYFDVPIDVVPYGVNTSPKAFCPVRDKMVLKKEIHDKSYEDRNSYNFETEGRFVAFSLGQSQTRKNWTAARDAWRIFAEGKNDVLYIAVIHGTTRDNRDKEWGVQLGDYDPYEFVKTPQCILIDYCLPDRFMLSFMQASDVLLFPTIGEGFGLPVLEAMACGCVPVVTNFSSVTDFCNGNNSFLLNDWVPWVAQWDVKRAVVNPKSMAINIQIAYDMWKAGLLNCKSVDAVATAKKYSWDKSAYEMSLILKREVVKDRKFCLYKV